MKANVWILGVVLVASACRPHPSPEAKAEPDPTVLAVVGGTEIRAADLETEIAYRKTVRLSPTEREAVLREMVDHAASLARARELGLDRDPGIRRRLEAILVAEVERRELQPRLRTLTEPPPPVASEPRAVVRSSPDQLRLAVLQLSAPPRMTPKRREFLEGRMRAAKEQAARLPAGEPGFGGLAIDFSDHQESRYQGGDRGWFTAGAGGSGLPGEVLAAAGALRTPGEISDVVQTRDGLYLVRLMERVQSKTQANAESLWGLRQAAVREQKERTKAEYREDLRRRAGVTWISRPTSEAAESGEPTGPEAGRRFGTGG